MLKMEAGACYFTVTTAKIRHLLPLNIPCIVCDCSGSLMLSQLHEYYQVKLSYAYFKTYSFLPRDAMHKRGYCRHAVSVCPSVCLSDCHVRGSCQNE